MGWKVKYKDIYATWKSFDPKSVQADHEALEFLLTDVWREHTRATGQVCPHEFKF